MRGHRHHHHRHHHGHHHHGQEPHRRRRFAPLAYYVRSRLRRRLFVWFGVTILLSGIVAATTVGALSGSRGGWRESLERVATFVGHRFGEVWDDPVARDRLAQRAADELRLAIELHDADGQTMARFGGTCPPRSAELRAPVVRDGRVLGELAACQTEPLRADRSAVGLGLLGVLGVLWAASGAIAWRLTRPLAQLVQVTQAFGEGKLSTRASLPRGPGELSVLARTFNDMADRIQKQIADQRELLAVVSHEIRTPLGHMRVLIDLARDGEDPGILDELEREVLEVDRLVDKLLASSRLEFDQVDRRPLRVDELVARALTRAELPPELMVVETDALTIHGDATLLSRALANLVDNARVHGGGLRALRVYRRDGSLYLAAEDEGPGLPVEDRERLFESFVRGGGGGKLGLGLALVERIARAHGGLAFAEDREEGGARVGFCLPESKDEPGEAATPAVRTRQSR
ncbi:HAMP domain-containing sensor histidine kinase [Paraliomyxa miuraensis]|uniref:HAMP domain-containing sensor histidine kinase n=1 Tax=Paraliomyxa miuraensis TaxID=376150 RepID=UPI0022518AEB|nr:ATP-binding protein [Paraliomyxa miuraensis]MCX4242413.1 HAMP domain-containing protein [Paraliomyxa miuraensis]